MNRLLNRLDDWAQVSAPDVVQPPHRFEPTSVSAAGILEMDLRRQDIGTIVWAAGYRPDYSWLDVPVLDHKGRLRHDGGIVTDAPGMYVLGGNLLRTRRSSYIAGADRDSDELADHLHEYLGRQVPRTARSTGRMRTGSSRMGLLTRWREHIEEEAGNLFQLLPELYAQEVG
jgi:putative flavoprotein involved in K+ transport